LTSYSNSAIINPELRQLSFFISCFGGDGLVAKKRLIWPFIPNFIAGISIAGVLLAPNGGLPEVLPAATADSGIVQEAAANLSLKLEAPSIPSVGEIETKVRAYFRHTPMLAEVARCESHFRHFNTDGTLRAGYNTNGTKDVGVMQINTIWHEKAKDLGFDLSTLKGNMDFAKWLYDRQGLQPWMSSSRCWGKNPNRVEQQQQLADAS
jgi:hypothetical protein